MTRIGDLFGSLDRPAFIAYLVAGHPDPAGFPAAAQAVITGGADILELGMPFSDPVADGPTIQHAHTRALGAGTTVDRYFAAVREIRRISEIPLVLMVYCNTVHRRGVERFYREARGAGADGVLVVDMPPEEGEQALAAARENGLDQIFLVAPSTSDERLDLVANAGTGFLYLASLLGVTGARDRLSGEASRLINRVRSHTRLPLAVGFGISRPEHARALVGAGADGIIVGSAIVQLVETHAGDPERMAREIREFVKGMRDALGG
ncbi:MAG TPA: tryptophan synthase subunit alpha [Methanomicrobiales archaeon]|jgi:tryptophan synthase alpha chain|nr:tryptophan synthase subunit alpha [Methanomicrobiales archaeon]